MGMLSQQPIYSLGTIFAWANVSAEHDAPMEAPVSSFPHPSFETPQLHTRGKPIYGLGTLFK